MAADFLPIILGSDENAYANARLFHEAYGVRSLLLCRYQLPATAYSSILRIETIQDFEKPDVFVEALLNVLHRESSGAEKLLVIPCVDYYTELLSKNYDAFEGLIANPILSETLLDQIYAKHRFYELCKTHGLPYPETLVIAPEDRERAADSLPGDFPIVLKPENSNASDYLGCHFPGKKKVYYIHSREEYCSLTAAMTVAGYNGTLVAQEYIPGGEDSLWMLNTYSDSDGIVRAMGLGQVLLADHHPLMRGNSVAIITRYNESIMEQVRNFLQEIHYVGFANFDLKTDERTGRIVFMECNPRMGRSSFFLRAAGLNLMRIFAEDVVYGHRNDCVYVKDNALWRNVPMYVLDRYMGNRELYQEARHISDCGLSICTRYYPMDNSLKRFAKMLRYDASLIRSFHRYPSNED